jgi:hypothetical protein
VIQELKDKLIELIKKGFLDHLGPCAKLDAWAAGCDVGLQKVSPGCLIPGGALEGHATINIKVFTFDFSFSLTFSPGYETTTRGPGLAECGEDCGSCKYYCACPGKPKTFQERTRPKFRPVLQILIWKNHKVSGSLALSVGVGAKNGGGDKGAPKPPAPKDNQPEPKPGGATDGKGNGVKFGGEGGFKVSITDKVIYEYLKKVRLLGECRCDCEEDPMAQLIKPEDPKDFKCVFREEVPGKVECPPGWEPHYSCAKDNNKMN